MKTLKEVNKLKIQYSSTVDPRPYKVVAGPKVLEEFRLQEDAEQWATECKDYVEHSRFEECGSCDHYHPIGFGGDCRDDSNRFTFDELPEDAEIIDLEDE